MSKKFSHFAGFGLLRLDKIGTDCVGLGDGGGRIYFVSFLMRRHCHLVSKREKDAFLLRSFI